MQQTIAALVTAGIGALSVRAWGKTSALARTWSWKERSDPREAATRARDDVECAVRRLRLPEGCAVRVSSVQKVRHVEYHGSDRTGEAFTGVVVYFRHPDQEEHVVIIDTEDVDG